jgi:hypothetical protein
MTSRERRDRAAAWTRADRAKDPERYKRYAAKSYARHAEIRRLNARKKYAENPQYHAAMARERRQNATREQREHRRTADRAHHLRTKYGLTIAEYDNAFAAQGGVCAICKTLPGTRRLAVDHSHKEPKTLRGLLCFFCNHKIAHRLMTLEKAQSLVPYLAGETAAKLGWSARVVPERKRKKRKEA